MKSTIEKVAEFHKMTNCPILETPTIPSRERYLLRLRLIREELDELAEAFAAGDTIEVADALTDLQYVLDGTYLECGMQNIKERLFDEVQRSNMSKSCKDYKSALVEKNKLSEISPCHIEEKVQGNSYSGCFIIVRDSDQKILKPSTYSPADLKAIVFPE